MTPVVRFPHKSVMVLVSNPLPMALRTEEQRFQSDARGGTGGNDNLVVVPEDGIHHCFNPAVQFVTTVIGAEIVDSVGTVTRNRWPLAATW